MQTLFDKHLHHLPIDEVVELLESDSKNGLDIFEVKHRQERFGPNLLTSKRGKSPLVRFFLQFNNPLLYILLAASVIAAVMKDMKDGIVIFGVVIFNVIIGFIQESKAEKAVEALAKTMTTEATVVRAGKTQRISAVELVVGDLVLLQSGNKVPADMRLIRSRDLQVSESVLTGESVPVQKDANIVFASDVSLADRRNMAYTSTLVTYGQAAGIVIATGNDTEIGRISQLISTAQKLETPLTRKIVQFSRTLLYVILGMAAISFLMGMWRKQPLFDMLMTAIAMAVCAIPESLPTVVTVTLAIGVSRMARRRAIIRKLPAVETLGSTTVICSDKTGTLTKNQMTVQQIIADNVRYEVTGSGYTPSGQILRQGAPVESTSDKVLMECLKAGLLCNDSQLIENEGRWEAQGDPTEVALIVSAYKSGFSLNIREQLPRLDSIPFESQHQYMATLHDIGIDKPRLVYVKGAVEVILEKCKTVLDASGKVIPLEIDKIHQNAEKMAAEGLRVLAFANGELSPGTAALTHANVASGLTFLGLQGMIDPPRPEVITAIQNCKTAGIHIKMITGDHALTAASIAQQIGLNAAATHQNVPAVLTGKTMAEYGDEEFIDMAERTAVFARVSPEQKLRLVEALQAREHVVAMTGDGVNDAPALKQADIGIAMGVSGTAVAKEASDMILTDDNFASIEAAVEEGRGVFDNLTKFITWALPTNLGEGLVLLAAVFTGVTLPILPIQLLWINMVSSGVLGITLAFEPKEPDIMQRLPRDPKSSILTPMVMWRILLVGALISIGAFGLFELELISGTSIAEARTVVVNVIIMIELFYLFNSRSLTQSIFQIGVFSNPWVIIGAVGMFFLQLLFTYVPVMNKLFSSAPISLNSWGRILGVASISYIIVMCVKLLTRRRIRIAQESKDFIRFNWSLNATIIEACSCPILCRCYFNTKPVTRHENHDISGTSSCRFNSAFRINKGHYGNIKLHGAKFWVAGERSGSLTKGQMSWITVTFEASIKKDLRNAIISVLHHLYPIKLNSITMTKDANIEWQATKDSAEALIDGGKTAEIVLRSSRTMSECPAIIKNLKFWKAARNNGFVLIPNKTSAYSGENKSFGFKGTNGFVVTINISSKD